MAPKMSTLISTANMHLKLRNPAVAAEIYSRLLQDANVGPREREVATRVLHGEIMLGKVEFFCGSGVARDLTGIDWTGLVNLGAERLLLVAPTLPQ